MDSYQIREIERRAKLKEKVENATGELIDAMNIMGVEDEVLEALFDKVTHSHRTLQATFVRTLKGFLGKYGQLEFFDARNQGAVEYARAATAAAKDSYIPHVQEYILNLKIEIIKKVKRLRRNGKTFKKISKVVNLSIGTVYKLSKMNLKSLRNAYY